MKLPKVEAGGRLITKLKLAGLRAVMLGERAPDVVRVLIYRPELFGTDMNTYFQSLLRGPSEWTLGERELFAAFVSKTNQCRFCSSVHRAVAVRALGERVVDGALEDYRTARVTPQVRATLGFLEKLTQTPQNIGHADAKAVFAAGVSRPGLELAIHVATVFSIINRIADSLGFEVPSASALAKVANVLFKRGYEL